MCLVASMSTTRELVSVSLVTASITTDQPYDHFIDPWSSSARRARVF